jgi:hypothetical protein
MKKTIKLTESELSNLIKRVVKENVNMNEEMAAPKGGLTRKMYTLYNKEKMNVEIVSGPMGIETGLYQITTKDSDGKYYNLIFDCRRPDSLKIKGRPLSSVENTDLTGEMLSKFCK